MKPGTFTAFEKTESIARRLARTIIVIAACFLLIIGGMFFSSRSFLDGLTELHQTNQIYDVSRQVNQIISSLDEILSKLNEGGSAGQALPVLRMAIDQESQLLDKALKLSEGRPALKLEVQKINEAIARFTEACERLFSGKGNFKEDSLIARQFALEAIDLLAKFQIQLKSNSDRIFGKIYDGRFRPLIAGITLAIIFTCFSLFMGLGITRQIHRAINGLLEATARVTKGDLSHRAAIVRPDEIGLLTNAFNQMTQSLQDNTVSMLYVQNIIESMQDSVITLDRQLTIVQSNKMTTEIFGYEASDLNGKPCAFLFSENFDFSPGLRETSCLSKSGQQIPVSVSLSRLHGQGENSSGLVCVIEDITERKKAETEMRDMNLALSAANKELEAFSYSVSHDLRAPLRGIDGFSQALLDDLGPKLDKESANHLSRIRVGVQRMGKLIDDLLGLAKLSRKEMIYKPIDIAALVKDVFEELKESEPERKVELTMRVESMKVNADPDLVRVLLENLIGNAWKYTGKVTEARIEFGVIRRDDSDSFYVKDNGAGFDMAYSQKLFGAFQRLHRADEFPGTGVGLATAQRIVHRHGGKISAESEINKGTIFYFSLG